jgi:hypothetical protein
MRSQKGPGRLGDSHALAARVGENGGVFPVPATLNRDSCFAATRRFAEWQCGVKATGGRRNTHSHRIRTISFPDRA